MDTFTSKVESFPSKYLLPISEEGK
jgi:hypothetical protein